MSGEQVVAALRAPEALPGWPAARWDVLVRQARRADLLARVAHAARGAGVFDRLPAAPRAHLEAALRHEAAQHEDIRREVRFITAALAAAGARTVLLKGGAYVVAGRAAAAGRVLSDIDVIVPRAQLPDVEASLMLHGWATTHHSAYDQRYYRQWMHELPPMRHIHRNTVIDVHHAILPDTARLRPSSALLLEAAVPVPGWPGVHTLAVEDMVLHSMAHLFHNEELSHGLRDLSDLDLLLREAAAADAGFWTRLLARAQALDLRRPLAYGLRHAARVFATPVPRAVLAEADRGGPGPLLLPLMDALWRRGLAVQHSTAPLRGAALARFLLYVRAHWLRMPPLLLARHLATKALTRPET